ncbi:tail assembly chaperone [Mycobacterium phage Ritam007]|nr:tail assembly chaperone [Mycobacterium phage Saroj]UZV39539.1 tail assembly chaperone [Mycobacterium phage Ritam007]
MSESPHRPENAGKSAAEQAEQYSSVFAPRKLVLDDGTELVIPPHPNLRMLDDDALAALEALNFELESYDREPDIFIPEQKIKDKDGNEIVLPAETKPGPLKTNPYRKTDKDGNTTIMNPPYEVQVAKIALGEEDYAKLRAGTINGRKGSAADVWRAWNEQSLEVKKRVDADPKSDGSSLDLEAVSSPDSE